MYSPATQTATQVYRQIGRKGEIENASPHRLIQLMMEYVLTKIGVARGHMQRGNVQAKGESIGDAINVIEGLQASLNHNADERMSENFDALYAYMMRRLLEANLHNDESILEEVAGLMRELKEAWDSIADEV